MDDSKIRSAEDWALLFLSGADQKSYAARIHIIQREAWDYCDQAWRNLVADGVEELDKRIDKHAEDRP